MIILLTLTALYKAYSLFTIILTIELDGTYEKIKYQKYSNEMKRNFNNVIKKKDEGHRLNK